MKRKSILSVAVCLIMVVALLATTPLAASATNTTAAGRTGTIAKGTQVYAEADSSSDSYTTNVSSYKITIEEETTVDGELWYKYDSDNALAFFFKNQYPYVKASDVTLEDSGESGGDSGGESSDETTLESTVDGIGISVKGNIPEGVTLSAESVAYEGFDFEGFNIEEETFITAMDIKLYESDGKTEWQPSDGEKVTVTMDAEALGMSDNLEYAVTHKHGDEINKLGEYEVEDGKVSFETDGFSVFVVTGLWGKADTAYGQNVTMYVGDTLYLKCDVEHYNRDNYTKQNHNWTVNPNPVFCASTATYTYPEGSSTETRNNSYIGITALATGTVEVKCIDTRYTVTVKISEKPAEKALTIEDTINSDGCLIPKYTGDTSKVNGYKWYRTDPVVANSTINENSSDAYTEVIGEALSTTYVGETNGVNVAVDQGGKCWYIVKAVDKNGKVLTDSDGNEIASDPYWIPYSNEIENGSFEQPEVNENNNPFNEWWNGESHNIQFNQEDTRYTTTAANVQSGNSLWWKTTGISDTAPGRAIEIIRPAESVVNVTGYYTKPADNDQYAELNCEAVGTLYQDVLTAPGSTLKWSFSHRGREGQDEMAVVIMPAASADTYAQKIQTAGNKKTEIESVLAEIQSVSGAKVYRANGTVNGVTDNSMNLSGLKATNSDWQKCNGTYTTPSSGQYMTRFFFVSISSSSGSNTMGNFIDGVSFDDRLDYTIEYYVDESPVKVDRETGKVKPFTTVTASKTGNYTDYALEKVVKETKDGEGKTTTDEKWGSTSMKVGSDGVVLRLYYVTKGISITKKVELDKTDGMTASAVAEAKKTILEKYNDDVTFALYDSSNKCVANATVKVNNETGEGIATFISDNKKFVPDKNATYTVKESSTHDVDGYVWSHEDITFKMDNSYAKSVEYVNKYEPLADLTITKEGIMPVDHDDSYLTVSDNSSLESQSTIFRVTGPKNYSQEVVICGNGSVTIKGLPIGEYTVTEVTDWSWRYTPVDSNKEKEIQRNVTITADGGNVMFANSRITDGNTNHWKWLNGGAYCKNLFKENSTGN